MASLPVVWIKNSSKSLHKENPVPDYVRVILVTDMNGRKRKLYIPAALDLDRPKRPRANFSSEQLKVLELEFKENHFVEEKKRQILARALGLTETQIKVWFQNRRTKLRRQELSASSSPTSLSKTYPSPTNPILSFSENYKLSPTIATPSRTCQFTASQITGVVAIAPAPSPNPFHYNYSIGTQGCYNNLL